MSNYTTNFLYDLVSDRVTGTWSMTGGTVNALYPLTNIDDGVPSNPVIYTVNPTRLICDHGTAVRLDLVSFIHCNFPAGYAPTVARGSVVGTALTSAVVTCPGPSEDGVPSNPFVDLTTKVGYANYRYTWIDLPSTSTLLWLGHIRLSSHKREAPQHLGFSAKTTEKHPYLEHTTDADTQIGYSRGTRARLVKGLVRTDDAGFAWLQSWWRGCRGRLYPFLLILDDTVNEAMWVKWGVTSDVVFERTILFEDVHDLDLGWEEVGRGLRPI
jgi:hypothetical protein